MGLGKTTFLALLAIGALIVFLYANGNLNNASTLAVAILFGIFAIGMAMEFDVFEIKQRPIVPEEIKVVEKGL